ncbi:CrcB family protein [Corynebacterium lizhenjunii]|uniref:Fluoride-specific ion channel n=1 Tax=Corynebacterium lizhenjunii TaxID=2709394 RepID=A0A7T0PAC0_9CORY|nr:CrcB family protein [Corynebacterium lizhenjunii]QPK78856.1 CrcB family protein [Corynebacterium lizhenjunii]
MLEAAAVALEPASAVLEPVSVLLEAGAVALGAGVGGMLRYALARRLPSPWGTLVANVLATVVAVMALQYFVAQQLAVALCATGFAGGLSTWSTLARELGTRVRQRRWAKAVGYAMLTLALTLLISNCI